MDQKSKWAEDNYAKTYVGCKTKFLLSEYCMYPTFLHHMGKIDNKSTLDLGCGEGQFTRIVKSKGASRVTGVDVSPVMIEKCQQQQIDCDYQVGNILNLGQIGQFDFVTANYVLPYANTLQEFSDMCRTFYVNLKPGGKFIGTVLNFRGDIIHFGDKMSKYGLVDSVILTPGEKIRKVKGRFANGFESFCNLFDVDDIENAFRRVGFRSFSVHDTIIVDEVLKQFPPGFWDSYLETPCEVCIVAEK